MTNADQHGFTLIEVLIALAIVAVALAASVRALGMSTQGTQAMLERSLALQAARNHLAELHLQQAFPPPGTQRAPCGQGALKFICEQQTRPSDHSAFRQITIRVQENERGPVLAQLHGILTSLR